MSIMAFYPLCRSYYNARFYDSVAGEFSSADTILPEKGLDLWGLSRYP